MVKPTRRRSNRRRYALTLPELEHSKAAVLNSLGSLQSRRSYKHAIEEFIRWYCSEPRLALNRAVVLRYRLHLESIPLAPSTINVRLNPTHSLSSSRMLLLRIKWLRSERLCAFCMLPASADSKNGIEPS
jgi:hypothetical protein